jgi:hypothetical protein
MVRKPKEDSAVATLDPPAIPTYSEIIRKRIRADVTSYRSLVSRAASGEQLSEAELIEAYETLGRIGYPPGQFEADLSATREHTKYKTRWAEFLAREPGERERQREVDRQIGELKQQLDTLKAEAHRLSFGSGLKAAANLQRANELAAQHSHVLSEDVDQVVEMRARALRVDAVGVKV